jgi:hypothetical protein
VAVDNAADLKKLWDERAMYYANDHASMDVMVDVYRGGLPDEYLAFFPEEMHIHLVNMIRLAWDDLAWLSGKEFPIYVPPEGDTTTEKTRAERLEKWGYGVNKAGRAAGGVTMKALMKILQWWMVGCANAVAMVLPDYQHQSPYFTWRDPRTHYPPVGWTPWNETRAVDSLFAYQRSLGSLIADYPEKEAELRQSISKLYNLGDPSRTSQGSRNEDELWLWVGEYYHRDCWMTATLETKAVTLARSDSGDRGHPGVQPAVSMGLYDPTGAKGRSLFEDQVSIQAAMTRMFSQKLDYYDRTLYPLIFTTPLAGKMVKVGAFAVNEYDITTQVPPRVDSIGPTNAIDADQTMQFSVGLSRMLNRNPEQMQGSGPAESAKALNELKEGINQTIREGIWPASIEALPALYTAAAEMDQNLWGMVTKKSKGVRKNANFAITYRPRTLLKGHEHDFEIEPGVGLAGYQGTLEILQLVGAELMSWDDALEQGEWVREPQEAKRRIQADRTEKLLWAELQAKAESGMLKDGAVARLRKMTQEGMDLFDAIDKLATAGELTNPPPELAAQDPLAALAAGGGAPPPGAALPPPQLSALRGGR